MRTGAIDFSTALASDSARWMSVTMGDGSPLTFSCSGVTPRCTA
jgi:hypothetical protein